MKRSVLVSILVLSVSCLYAKRGGPPVVKEIKYKGVSYSVIHFASDNPFKQNGGVILVSDPSAEKKKNYIKIYEVKRDDDLETDVQDIFITSIKIDKKRNALKITNENDDVYFMDLKTFSVTRRIQR